MKNCSNCGHEVNDEMTFCPECGTPVNGNDNSENEETSINLDDYASWYEKDIFHAVLSPLIKSFDNGRFFLYSAIVLIDILFSTILLSQPYSAYQMYKNHALEGLETSDKTMELIFAIIWLIIAIFSFGYWMKRIDRIISEKTDYSRKEIKK